VNTNFPPLTVENYKLLPESGPRYQLIQADLPAPNRFHQEISCNRIVAIHQFAFDGVDKIREVDEEEASQQICWQDLTLQWQRSSRDERNCLVG
jgi:hypothetical protein